MLMKWLRLLAWPTPYTDNNDDVDDVDVDDDVMCSHAYFWFLHYCKKKKKIDQKLSSHFWTSKEKGAKLKICLFAFFVGVVPPRLSPPETITSQHDSSTCSFYLHGMYISATYQGEDLMQPADCAGPGWVFTIPRGVFGPTKPALEGDVKAGLPSLLNGDGWPRKR